MRAMMKPLLPAIVALSFLALARYAHADAWQATVRFDDFLCHHCAASYDYTAATSNYDPGVVTKSLLVDGSTLNSTSFISADGYSFGKYSYRGGELPWGEGFIVASQDGPARGTYTYVIFSLIGFDKVKPLSTKYIQDLLGGVYSTPDTWIGYTGFNYGSRLPPSYFEGVGFGNTAFTTLVSFKDLQAVAAVPEPESSAMMLVGVALMGVVARRRKCRKPA